MALGICNFFGSFAGSYPISGSFSRSALNDEVGASSPVAVLTVGVCVGIALAIATTAPIFYYLPQTALSAIVISSLLGLLDFERFLWLATYDRKDAALWLIAFIGVLFAGVEIGILIAVCISLAFVVVEFVLAPMQELGAVHGHSRRAFRPISQYPDAERVPGVVILRCEAAIVFANAANVLSRLRCIVYGSDASSLANGAQRHTLFFFIFIFFFSHIFCTAACREGRPRGHPRRHPRPVQRLLCRHRVSVGLRGAVGVVPRRGGPPRNRKPKVR